MPRQKRTSKLKFMSTERLNGPVGVHALRPEEPFGLRPQDCLAGPAGVGCAAVLPWSARDWGSRAERPASSCCWSGCCFFRLCQDCAAVAGCTAHVSVHSIPLPTWLAGRGMFWLGSPLAAGAVLEESPGFLHPPNALSVWTHVFPPHLASLQTCGAWSISEAGAKKKAFLPVLVALSSALILVPTQRAPASIH